MHRYAKMAFSHFFSHTSEPGLPDGLFSNQKFGYILEGLEMENVCIFYDHLEYFMAIWYNLCSFGILFPFLVCLDQEQSGNPGPYVGSSQESETFCKTHSHCLPPLFPLAHNCCFQIFSRLSFKAIAGLECVCVCTFDNSDFPLPIGSELDVSRTIPSLKH
jgi:hypothetical protein